MKKAILFCCLVLALGCLAGCQNKATKCRIHGTIPAKYNNVRIFLVPLKDQSKEAVDSVVIRDGKFEFETEKYVVADIRLDYHHRLGIQNLLVVTEPGDIVVHIDSVSSSKGTPQNDSLQMWKDLTIKHNKEYSSLMSTARKAMAAGDSTSGLTIKTLADSIHHVYVRRSVKLGENLKKGPLHDFLLELYPRTYKQKMPDGTVVEKKAAWVLD